MVSGHGSLVHENGSEPNVDVTMDPDRPSATPFVQMTERFSDE